MLIERTYQEHGLNGLMGLKWDPFTRILKDFVAVGEDYHRDVLSFGEIHQQVKRANLQRRLID